MVIVGFVSFLIFSFLYLKNKYQWTWERVGVGIFYLIVGIGILFSIGPTFIGSADNSEFNLQIGFNATSIMLLLYSAYITAREFSKKP